MRNTFGQSSGSEVSIRVFLYGVKGETMEGFRCMAGSRVCRTVGFHGFRAARRMAQRQ